MGPSKANLTQKKHSIVSSCTRHLFFSLQKDPDAGKRHVDEGKTMT